MQSQSFERYQTGDSLLHHLDPRVKVVMTGLFILSTVLIPDGAWAAFLITLIVVLALTQLAGLPWGIVLKRSLVILPFTLTALTTIFVTPGVPLTAIHIGPWTLTPTDAGLIRFASIIARSLLSVQIAILLTATTPFPDLLHAFRHLRLPRALVGTLAFMYRYLFVLSDEAARLMRARQARSARLPQQRGHRSLLWRGKVAGAMVGQLFLRSLERGERVHQAMLARGYRGHIYTLNPHVMTPRDGWFAALGVVVILIIQLIARLTLH
jgi:cobalt/nickel transport system permease protein